MTEPYIAKWALEISACDRDECHEKLRSSYSEVKDNNEQMYRHLYGKKSKEEAENEIFWKIVTYSAILRNKKPRP